MALGFGCLMFDVVWVGGRTRLRLRVDAERLAPLEGSAGRGEFEVECEGTV